jgi:hypothetical protein
MRIPALSAELIYFAGLSEADYFGNTKPCCTMQRVVQRLVMLNLMDLCSIRIKMELRD